MTFENFLFYQKNWTGRKDIFLTQKPFKELIIDSSPLDYFVLLLLKKLKYSPKAINPVYYKSNSNSKHLAHNQAKPAMTKQNPQSYTSPN